jgi:hypothetical protein
MPYNANFSVTQSIDCATITITDTSSNPSGEALTSRKLYLQKADGTYIAPSGQDYYTFVSSSLTIPLPQDFALDIVFQAIPAVVTSGSVYIKEIMQALVCNLKQFQLGKVKTVSATPSILNDQNFQSSLFELNTEINSALLAVSEGLDIQSSQGAIDRGYYLIANQNNFF